GQRARLLQRVEAVAALGPMARDPVAHLVVAALRCRDEQPPRAERLRPREREAALARTRPAAHDDQARRPGVAVAFGHDPLAPSRDRFGTTTTTGMRVPRISRSFSYPKNSRCWMARFSAPSTIRS